MTICANASHPYLCLLLPPSAHTDTEFRYLLLCKSIVAMLLLHKGLSNAAVATAENTVEKPTGQESTQACMHNVSHTALLQPV